MAGAVAVPTTAEGPVAGEVHPVQLRLALASIQGEYAMAQALMERASVEPLCETADGTFDDGPVTKALDTVLQHLQGHMNELTSKLFKSTTKEGLVSDEDAPAVVPAVQQLKETSSKMLKSTTKEGLFNDEDFPAVALDDGYRPAGGRARKRRNRRAEVRDTSTRA